MSFVIVVSLILYLKILLGENSYIFKNVQSHILLAICITLPVVPTLILFYVENLKDSIRKVFRTLYSYLAYHFA